MFLTPRWLASHVFVIALVAAFVAAGLWQIDRLQDRQATNERVAGRMGEVWLLSDLLAQGLAPDEYEFRRVQLTGTFDDSRQILIANRSDEGAPGFWVWTAFTPEGESVSESVVVVNRGFVPRSVGVGLSDGLSIAEVASTAGLVTIEGLLRLGDLDARVSEDGTQLTRPDTDTAVEVLGVESALDSGLYLALEAQEPLRVEELPRPIPRPDLGEGPHRSYAFQWFTFATIGVVGYSLLLRRISRGDQSRGDVPVADTPNQPRRDTDG